MKIEHFDVTLFELFYPNDKPYTLNGHGNIAGLIRITSEIIDAYNDIESNQKDWKASKFVLPSVAVSNVNSSSSSSSSSEENQPPPLSSAISSGIGRKATSFMDNYTRRAVGITNASNDCFMSSYFQCVAQNRFFLMEMITSTMATVDVIPEPTLFLGGIKEFILRLKSGTDDPVSLDDFKTKIVTETPNAFISKGGTDYNDGGQHDVMEFWNFLPLQIAEIPKNNFEEKEWARLMNSSGYNGTLEMIEWELNKLCSNEVCERYWGRVEIERDTYEVDMVEVERSLEPLIVSYPEGLGVGSNSPKWLPLGYLMSRQFVPRSKNDHVGRANDNHPDHVLKTQALDYFQRRYNHFEDDYFRTGDIKDKVPLEEVAAKFMGKNLATGVMVGGYVTDITNEEWNSVSWCPVCANSGRRGMCVLETCKTFDPSKLPTPMLVLEVNSQRNSAGELLNDHTVDFSGDLTLKEILASKKYVPSHLARDASLAKFYSKYEEDAMARYSNALYELRGVIQHIPKIGTDGKYLNTKGHYIATTKDTFDEKWYKHDDSYVTDEIEGAKITTATQISHQGDTKGNSTVLDPSAPILRALIYERLNPPVKHIDNPELTDFDPNETHEPRIQGKRSNTTQPPQKEDWARWEDEIGTKEGNDEICLDDVPLEFDDDNDNEGEVDNLETDMRYADVTSPEYYEI